MGTNWDGLGSMDLDGWVGVDGLRWMGGDGWVGGQMYWDGLVVGKGKLHVSDCNCEHIIRRTQLDIGRVIDAITFTQVDLTNINRDNYFILVRLPKVIDVYLSLLMMIIRQTSVLNYTYFLNNIISLFGAAG